MKIFLFRLLFILFLVLFQFSLLDILFPSLGTPVFILVSVVAWVLLEGFFPALRMTIPLVLLFELFSTQTLGSLSIYAVLLAYATSFLSKRVIIEHRGYGLFGYAVIAAFGAWGYRLFEILFFRHESFTILLSLSNIFGVLTLGIISFFFLYSLIQRFERSIDLSEKKNMMNIR